MHRGSFIYVALFLFLISAVVTLWLRDVIREAAHGHHTLAVQRGLRIGFALFIFSEVMFFFSFFWAYFHCALAPSVELGCQ